MRQTLSAAVLLLCTACGSPTEPPGAPSVRTETDVVRARIESGYLLMTVPLAITNSGLPKLWVLSCADVLERQEPGGDWIAVWSPLCPLDLQARPIEVLSGETLRTELSVLASVNYQSWPAWPDDVIAGHYRVRVSLWLPGKSGAIPPPLNTSNVFEVQLQEE